MKQGQTKEGLRIGTTEYLLVLFEICGSQGNSFQTLVAFST